MIRKGDINDLRINVSRSYDLKTNILRSLKIHDNSRKEMSLLDHLTTDIEFTEKDKFSVSLVRLLGLKKSKYLV